MAREQFMVEIEFVLRTVAKAEPATLGHWLRLCAHSAERLLGGRLKACKAWSDPVAWRTVGMPRSAFDELVVADLGWWDGDDLVLCGYDLHGERLWMKQSKGGKNGNQNRWSNRTPIPTPNRRPIETPTSDTDVGTESETDKETDTETDGGDRIRDSDSDSETAASSDARARGREATGESDPLLAAAAALGAFLIDPKDRSDLRATWGEIFARTGCETDSQVRWVFENGKRLTGHAIRYPTGFEQAVTAHHARVKRNADVDESRRSSSTRRESDERRKAELADAEAAAQEPWARVCEFIRGQPEDATDALIAMLPTYLHSVVRGIRAGTAYRAIATPLASLRRAHEGLDAIARAAEVTP